MFDELDQLAQDGRLYQLLSQYNSGNQENRETWQDRPLEFCDCSVSELTKLHGQLLAYDWVEQNTGSTPNAQLGPGKACYRVTQAGRRAWRVSSEG